jgi:hypothetical protein
MVVVVIVTIMLFRWKNLGKSSFQKGLYWALPLLSLAVPFLYGSFKNSYGAYLRHLMAFHQTSSALEQLSVSISCFSALFWGMDPSRYTYQPVWGGFLNPVWGALFWVGLLCVIQSLRVNFSRWLLAALVFLLLPGLLTSDCEPFRMVPVIPVLFLITALGWNKLMRLFHRRKTVFLSLLLFLPAVGLDGRHLFVAYHHLWDSSGAWRGYVKSLERYRAYELLKQTALEKGPGLIFTNFVQGLPDQTLAVADYDFNAAQNSGLSFEKARWAAVLTNVNYQPFLSKRFSDGKYAWLSRDDPPADGGLMLWVMPVESSRRQELKVWQMADLALRPFIDENIGFFPGLTYQKSLKALLDVGPTFQNDAFLRSCFWEKAADIYFKDYALAAASNSNRLAIQALENAAREGYPAAHLYEHLGVFYLMERDKKTAGEAFKKALKAPVNHTDSAQYLKVR